MKSILKAIIPVGLRKAVKYLFTFVMYPNPFAYYYQLESPLSLRRKINLYYALFPSKKDAFKAEIDFLNSKAEAANAFTYVFPHDFVSKYSTTQVNVLMDEQNGLFYVLHAGKKLYYSKQFKSKEDVQKMYNSIAVEQDEDSPHRYLTPQFNVHDHDVVVDIGAAEGNFGLEVIERVKALYIVEPEEHWIEALEATFEPWKEKVHIINKYVTDVNNEESVSLDRLLGDSPVNFIKMDVEGAEISILKSAGSILAKNNDLRLAVCTYHENSHAGIIGNVLKNQRFDCSFSNGHMLFLYRRLTPPYFRRGLIRASKVA